jgi:hypothetical protein
MTQGLLKTDNSQVTGEHFGFFIFLYRPFENSDKPDLINN